MTPILTVSEFVSVLNGFFSELGEFAVEGEVVTLKISQNKALFIDLKDPNGNALLKLANYAPRVVGLNQITEGMKVVVYGSMNMYGPTGGINFQVRKIEPQGEGALKVAFERLKQLLDSEGLFAEARKRALPLPIEKIALVTAVGSAAFSDFCKILQEHHSGIIVDFYPVTVQGGNAEEEIIQAFNQANESSAQLIVLVRGGGSLEDLRAFNSENLARTIARSKLPVMVGVGHEVDTSIADLVADVRASTPSQAAYYLASQNQNYLQSWYDMTDTWSQKLLANLPSQLYLDRLFQAAEQRLLLHLPNRQTIRMYDSFLNRGLNSLQAKIADLLEFNTNFVTFPLNQLSLKLTDYRQNIINSEKLLKSYSPEEVLKRGYTLVQTEQGKYVSSVNKLKLNERIKIHFHDGDTKARIEL